MKAYRYVFRWNTSPKEISIIGTNVTDVYRGAAKFWCPAMSKQSTDEVVDWFKQSGGRVVRLEREIRL